MSDHGHDEGNGLVATQPDETPVGGLAITVVVGVIVFVAIFASVYGLFWQVDRDAEIAKSRAGFGQRADEVAVEQEKQLAAYGVGDAQRETFAIPIESAEQKVLAELAANPEANVTGPAPPLPPAVAPGAAPSSTPAPNP